MHASEPLAAHAAFQQCFRDNHIQLINGLGIEHLNSRGQGLMHSVPQTLALRLCQSISLAMIAEGCVMARLEDLIGRREFLAERVNPEIPPQQRRLRRYGGASVESV